MTTPARTARSAPAARWSLGLLKAAGAFVGAFGGMFGGGCGPDAEPDPDTDTTADTDIVDTDAVAFCPPSIDAALLACVETAQEGPQGSDLVLNILNRCLDGFEVADAWFAYCDGEPTNPACALDYDAFVADVLPECGDRARAVLFEDICMFPPAFRDVITTPGIAPVSKRVVTSAADLSDEEAAQLAVAAGVASASEALSLAGSAGWTELRVVDAGLDRGLVFYTAEIEGAVTGAGFSGDRVDVLARVEAGQITDCAAERGLEGTPCELDVDCRPRSCRGVARDPVNEALLGLGVCDTLPPAGDDVTCSSDRQCNRGLVCSPTTPAATGSACTAAWRRRAFRFEPADPALVAGGSLRVPIIVSGLAIGASRVRLDLVVDQASTNALKVSLRNPAGTLVEVASSDARDLVLSEAPVSGIPLAEPANGRWSLIVEDVGGSAQGTLVDAIVTIDSRSL